MIHSTLHQLSLQDLQRKGNQYNFKCPVCLDSRTNKNKKRAWIYEKKGSWMFHCFNCSTSHSYINFVKLFFPEIYRDIIKLSFKKQTKVEVKEEIKESLKKYSEFPLISVDNLDKTHEAYLYIQNRKIPSDTHHLLYYTNDFTSFTNRMTNGRYPDWKFNDQRIIIPFYSKNKNINLFQGRAIDESFARYITVKLVEDSIKVFGVERIKYNEKIVCCEGPFDSLFINNSVAFGGSDLSEENLNSLFSKNQIILLFDLEPRNKEINNKIEKFLKKGYNVSLLPKNLTKYGKDINSMIEKGLTKEDINAIIHKNIINGKLGLIKFQRWRVR